MDRIYSDITYASQVDVNLKIFIGILPSNYLHRSIKCSFQIRAHDMILLN
jgi:hypothetical protein